MVQKGGSYRFWWGKLREGDNSKDTGVDGSVMLRNHKVLTAVIRPSCFILCEIL